MQAAGEKVGLVALFDTQLSLADYEKLELTEQSAIRWIAPHLNLSVKELKKLPLEQQWQRIAEQANMADGVGVAEIRRLAQVCTAHLEAATRYRPKPYQGRVVLFQADAGRGRLDRRWKSLCPRLRVETVPGNHYSMLRKPQVDVLADRLGHYLADNVGAGQTGEELMRLILFLLRASWQAVVLAGVVGGVSGAASVGLMAMIVHTLRPARCLVGRGGGPVCRTVPVILATQIGSQCWFRG